MLTSLLIALCFSLGYFIESIVGFGGAIITYAILSFVIDLKSMIIAGMYLGVYASSLIVFTDYKSLDIKTLKFAIPLCFIGTVIGVFIFTIFPPIVLSAIFAVFLTFLACKLLFFNSFKFPTWMKRKILFLGGISYGIFGIAGPFWVNALEDRFKNKASLRVTASALFAIFDLTRIIQLSLQGELEIGFFINILWSIIPLTAAIYLGYHIHLKISEKTFRNLIAVMTLLASGKFLSELFW